MVVGASTVAFVGETLILGVVDKTKLLFGVAGTTSYVTSILDYYHPDPNPTGRGEGYINTIHPSWDPYLKENTF